MTATTLTLGATSSQASSLANEPFRLIKGKISLTRMEDARIPTLACQILSEAPLNLLQSFGHCLGLSVKLDIRDEKNLLRQVAIKVETIANTFGITYSEAQTLVASHKNRTRACNFLTKIMTHLKKTTDSSAHPHTALEVQVIVQAIFRQTITRLLEAKEELDQLAPFVEASQEYQVYVAPENIYCFKTGSIIGLGSFGLVYRCQELFTKGYYATKFAVRTAVDTDLCSFAESNAAISREHRVLLELNPQGNLTGVQRPLILFFEVPYLRNVMQLGYVTDLYQGDLLSKCLKTASELFNILSGLVEGLMAIHEKGYYHRDIKPCNALRTEDRVVLADLAGSQNLKFIETLLSDHLKVVMQGSSSLQKHLDLIHSRILSIFTEEWNHEADARLLRQVLDEFKQTYERKAEELKQSCRQPVKSSSASFELEAKSSILPLRFLENARPKDQPNLADHLSIDAFAIQIFKIMKASDVYNLALSLLMLIDGCTLGMPSDFSDAYWSKIQGRLEALKIDKTLQERLLELFRKLTSDDTSTTNHQLNLEARLSAFADLQLFCREQKALRNQPQSA